jgi:glycosyltransferase involved in cell wall biosynthesis
MKAAISVIIPAYNHANFIGAAIESVIQQTLQPAQILIIDDGSTDSTQDVVRESKSVRYVRTAHAGAAAARNLGVDLAEENYLAFLDADDLWVANKLELQMETMQRQPDLDMVFGHVEEFYSAEVPVTERRCRLRISSAGYVFGTLLIRTESFKRVGKLDQSLRAGEFIDWYARALGLNGCMLEPIVMRRRVHLNNSRRREKASANDYARVFKSILDRRRDGVVGIAAET